MSVKIGIQLFSLKNLMKENPLKAINKASEIGYKYLEVANHNATKDFGVGFNIDSNRMKEILAPLGCKVISAHVFPLLDSNIDKVLEYFTSLGTKFIGISASFYKNKVDVINQCKQFEEIGKKCSDFGISLLYHNHYHEFQEFERQTVIEIMKENTDSKYLNFELDTFWAYRAGKNPVDIMESLGNRLKLIHQKDFSKTAKQPVNLLEKYGYDSYYDMDFFRKTIDLEDFTEIGLGQMNIQPIIDKANELGVEYVILEQDHTQLDEVESIKISMENFKKYKGVEL